jgi:outer membrane lipoprotein-sorting protein
MRKTLLTVWLLAVFVAPSVLAQTADEIVQKNIEARGGLQALKSKNSLRMTGTFEVQGMPMELTVLQKRPNLMRTEVAFQGMTVVDAFDGTTRWKVEPYKGVNDPTKATPDETAESAEQADFDGVLVDYRQKGATLELAGKETVDGKEAYKLKVRSKSGREQEMYFDAETYQMVKMTGEGQTEQGSQMIETRTSDHRTVDGVSVPHSIEIRIGDMPLSMTISKVEWDVDLPNSLFQMPSTPAQ